MEASSAPELRSVSSAAAALFAPITIESAAVGSISFVLAVGAACRKGSCHSEAANLVWLQCTANTLRLAAAPSPEPITNFSTRRGLAAFDSLSSAAGFKRAPAICCAALLCRLGANFESPRTGLKRVVATGMTRPFAVCKKTLTWSPCESCPHTSSSLKAHVAIERLAQPTARALAFKHCQAAALAFQMGI